MDIGRSERLAMQVLQTRETAETNKNRITSSQSCAVLVASISTKTTKQQKGCHMCMHTPGVESKGYTLEKRNTCIHTPGENPKGIPSTSMTTVLLST